jgi:hypothetical protein
MKKMPFFGDEVEANQLKGVLGVPKEFNKGGLVQEVLQEVPAAPDLAQHWVVSLQDGRVVPVFDLSDGGPKPRWYIGSYLWHSY